MNSLKQKINKDNFLKALELSLIWIPVLILTLVNQSQFNNKNVILPVSRTAGYSDAFELQTADYFSFLQMTFVEFVLIAPIFTILLAMVFNNKIFKSALLVLATTILSLNFINLLSVANVSNLISFNFMYSSIEWGASNPDIIHEYVSISSMIKFGVLMIMLLIIFYFSQRTKGVLYHLFRFSAYTYAVLSILAIPVVFYIASQAKVDDFNPKESFFLAQLNGLIEKEVILVDIEDLPNDTAGLIEVYREKTNSTLSNESPDFLKSAEKKNVIFFILESGPNGAVFKASDVHEFKNFDLMKQSGFYSEAHYSTYPYTSDGLFSIFSGLYSDKLRRKVVNGDYGLNDSSLLSILRKNDYFTSVYSITEFGSERDLEMFEKLGVDKQYFSADGEDIDDLLLSADHLMEYIDFPDLDERGKELLDRTYKYDIAALEKMMLDIEKSATNGEKFATVYLPQLGHAPWIDVAKDGDLFDDGAVLYSIQDKWLGYIMDRLSSLNILEDTMIVITSDHGLRTKTEYPPLPGSYIDEVTFNVPLLIYAPEILNETYHIPALTSHIDIQPTILSLLGLDWNEHCIVGSPVWDKNLKDRIVYYNGKVYFGNAGYSQNGKFISYNYIQQQVFQNDRMQFSQENALSGDVENYKYNIEFQQAFQKQLLSIIENNNYCNASIN